MKRRILGGTGISVSEGRRDDVVLATKFRGQMGPDPNHKGNSRRWILRAVEDSLRRLDTDYLDLYQVHRPDPDTDIDETDRYYVPPALADKSLRRRPEGC